MINTTRQKIRDVIQINITAATSKLQFTANYNEDHIDQ